MTTDNATCPERSAGASASVVADRIIINSNAAQTAIEPVKAKKRRWDSDLRLHQMNRCSNPSADADASAIQAVSSQFMRVRS